MTKEKNAVKEEVLESKVETLTEEQTIEVKALEILTQKRVTKRQSFEAISLFFNSDNEVDKLITEFINKELNILERKNRSKSAVASKKEEKRLEQAQQIVVLFENTNEPIELFDIAESIGIEARDYSSQKLSSLVRLAIKELKAPIQRAKTKASAPVAYQAIPQEEAEEALTE